MCTFSNSLKYKMNNLAIGTDYYWKVLINIGLKFVTRNINEPYNYPSTEILTNMVDTPSDESV